MHRNESMHIKSINVQTIIILLFSLCYSYDFIETAKKDSVDAIPLRSNKSWVMQSERFTPLILPKKMFKIHTSIALSGYFESSGISIENKHVYLDLILSPSDKFDITVISHPTFEYAIIQKTSNVGRVQYLSGIALTIGAGFASIPIKEDFRYKLFSRFKLPFNNKSWLKSVVHVEFKETNYSYFHFDLCTNLEIVKPLNLTIGCDFRNSHRPYFLKYESWESDKDTYDNRITAYTGFNVNINRHIRLFVTMNIAKEIDKSSFYPVGTGYFRAVW